VFLQIREIPPRWWDFPFRTSVDHIALADIEADKSTAADFLRVRLHVDKGADQNLRDFQLRLIKLEAQYKLRLRMQLEARESR
jgi:hypothetical protein